MKRRYLDTTFFKASNMAKDGNIDYKYWFDKTNNEKMKAAASMTAIAFNEPNFLQKKLIDLFFLIENNCCNGYFNLINI